MRTILITGGAGFIGSNFVRIALKNRCRIINLDKLTYAGHLESLDDISNETNYEFVKGDIGNRSLIKSLLFDFKPDAIINFAAESHVDRSIDGPSIFIDTNVVGTFNLLEEAKDYWVSLNAERKKSFRFLHVSTDEVFGSVDSGAYFTESSPYSPNSPYAASKASSDLFVRAYYQTFKIPTLITNCSNNYGPYQFPEKLIPLMILNAISGNPLPVYGDGLNIRDWLYVEDHCRAILKVLDKGRIGQTYNVGGNNEKSNIEIVCIICDILDKIRPLSSGNSYRNQITYVADRPGHDRRYAIDATKILCELGWKPEVKFTDGIKNTIDWYLENLQWCQSVCNGTKIGKRLGTGVKIDD